MTRQTNYAAPELQLTSTTAESIICASLNGPEKDFGFDWDDDLY